MSRQTENNEWTEINNESPQTELEGRKKKTGGRKFCHNVRGFVFCLAALQFVQVMGSGYSKSVLTSIERRYQLDTFQIGVLQSCFHIGNLSVILLVSYFGSKWHRPRAIAIGSFVMAISSLLSSMPQFIGGRYQPQHLDMEKLQSLPRIESATTNQPFATKQSALVRDYDWTIRDNTSFNFLRHPRKEMEDDNVAGATVTSKPSLKRSLCNYKDVQRIWKTSKLAVKQQDSGVSDDESSLYIIIAVGGVLKGMGHTPLHPLGMSFIDDYAARGNSAFYIGIVSALSLLGPAFGFLLGSFTTSIWVDTGWVSNPLTFEDRYGHAWVGAWWIGYLLMACLLMLASIPFYRFPKKLKMEDDDVIAGCFICVNGLKFRSPSESEDNENKNGGQNFGTKKSITSNGIHKTIETHNNNNTKVASSRTISFSTTDTSLKPAAATASVKRTCSAPTVIARLKEECNGVGYPNHSCSPPKREISGRISSSIRDFSFTLINLCTDPMFASITMGYVSLTSFLASSITYMSKYMESQFGRSASFANLINGSVNLPMAVVGNMAGGMIMRTRNLNVRQTVALVLCSLVVTIMCVGALLLFGCEGQTVVGVDHSSKSQCYDKCHCPEELIPVCDVTTNTSYRSPCHAGCSLRLENNMGFDNCQCLINNKDGVGKVRNGFCEETNCSGTLLFFIFMMGTASLSSGMAATPSTLSILRVAPSNEKALAIGVVFVFTRVLAWIPSPVYIGLVIDSSCLLWSQTKQNSQRKHCEIYNKRWLRHRMFGAIGLQLFCAIFFYFLSFYLASRRRTPTTQTAEVQSTLLQRDQQNYPETTV